MNILVCIKQVPDTSEEKLILNTDRNTVVREGLISVMNDFDGYALEAAARIKDKTPNTNIIVLSLGPAQARSVLKEGLSIAADKAYLVTDVAFAGSDAVATSYILSKAIKKIEESEGQIDAVFCGKQSIDGETAITGPGVSELLNYPLVTGCVNAELDGGCIIALKESKTGKMHIRVSLPCLLTFAKPTWNVRYSNIKRKLAANRAAIPVLSLTELPDVDRSRIGLDGSLMRVKNTLTPEKKIGGIVINEETPEGSAAKLCQLLDAAGVI